MRSRLLTLGTALPILACCQGLTEGDRPVPPPAAPDGQRPPPAQHVKMAGGRQGLGYLGPAPLPAGPLLHVSPQGNDANPGSEAAPLRHLAAAAALARPGTTVVLARGTYFERLLTRRGGEPDRPITFRAEAGSEGGAVILDGSQEVWPEDQNLGIVELRHPHVRLDGLALAHSRNSGVILAADDLAVTRCIITATRRHGISTDTDMQTAAGGRMPRQISLAGNVIHDAVSGGHTAGQGISLIADGFEVLGNELYGIDSVAIDVWLGSTHGEVADNLVHDNIWDGIYVDGGSYVRIDRNRVFGNKFGIAAGAEDPRYEDHHIWVFNNVVYDNRLHGLVLWEPDRERAPKSSHDVLFAHNTLAGNAGAINFAGSNLQGEFANNLGFRNGADVVNGGITTSRIDLHDNVFTWDDAWFVSAKDKDSRNSTVEPLESPNSHSGFQRF